MFDAYGTKSTWLAPAFMHNRDQSEGTECEPNFQFLIIRVVKGQSVVDGCKWKDCAPPLTMESEKAQFPGANKFAHMFCLVCIITYNGVLVNVFYLSQLIQHNLFLITNQFKILKDNNYFTNYIILFWVFIKYCLAFLLMV